MQLKTLTFALLSLIKLVVAADGDEPVTTVTTTPVQTQSITITAEENIFGTVYIYTDENGVLTTTTVFHTQTNALEPAPTSSTPVSTTTSPKEVSSTSASSVASADNTRSESVLVIPSGTYSRSTVTTLTTLANGSSAVLELVVLYTEEC